MSLEKQHVEEPKGNLSHAEAVEVLKGLPSWLILNW